MKERRLVNEEIRAPRIRLIDENGKQRGIVERKNALEEAKKVGLDLVEVAYNNGLSVCKIMDYGKYRYEQNKNAKRGRRKQKTIQIKEIKLRPNTDDHDFQFKANQARKFLEDGQKIRIILNFKGREIVHPEIGMNLIIRFADSLKDTSIVEKRAYLEGKRITMEIVPLKKREKGRGDV